MPVLNSNKSNADKATDIIRDAGGSCRKDAAAKDGLFA